MTILRWPKIGCQNLGQLPSMTAERFAALAQSTGARVFKEGGIWWRQGATLPPRSFFFRPLLPYRKYDWSRAWISLRKFAVFQHGVKDGQPYNSHLNFIYFDEVRNYNAGKLHESARRNLKTAINNKLTVCRLSDEQRFLASAYDIYLSFYGRTRYGWNTSRRHKDGFTRWWHHLFQFPELVIFGAFSEGELLSFEIGCFVEDALFLNTVVHSDKGLQLRTPDLMLHCLRMIARDTPGVELIYAGMMCTPGIDKFKLRRGGRLAALPAFVHLNPMGLVFLQSLSKGKHRRLVGLNEDEVQAAVRKLLAA